jgi:hypothetical protein
MFAVFLLWLECFRGHKYDGFHCYEVLEFVATCSEGLTVKS